MTRLVLKSLVLGFVTGTVFLRVAPFGLVIGFVEFLRPILAPGIDLFRPLFQYVSGPLLWMLGLVLNGLVYTMLFLVIFLARKSVSSRGAKLLTTLLVLLVFLALTGMLTNLHSWLTSPNKGWIFQVGA